MKILGIIKNKMDPGLDRDIPGLIKYKMDPGLAEFAWCNRK